MSKETTTNSWLIQGISKEKLETEKKLAILGAQIYFKRIELGMDQREFAKYIGVTQGLVSRWESGHHNFTIATLVSICNKLKIDLEVSIGTKEEQDDIIFALPRKNKFTDNTWETWKISGAPMCSGGVA